MRTTTFFMHIARTGGRSVGEVISQNHTNVCQIDASGCTSLNREHSEFSAFVQHDVYAASLKIAAPKNIITFLRDPIEAAYNFAKNLMGKNDEDVVASIANGKLNNAMVKQLSLSSIAECWATDVDSSHYNTALTNIGQFNFVGNFADFENEVRRMCTQFSWICPNPIPYISESTTRKVRKVVTVPMDIRTALEPLCSYDVALYNAVFNA